MLKLPICLLLLISCWHHPMLNAFFFKPSIITVTIEKYWYSVGDSVEIYCATADEAFNDLYFEDLMPSIPLNNTNYSIKAVDQKTILLQLYNVVPGQYNYICQSHKAKEDFLKIGVASFEVGYPPEIKNILFESIDLKQLRVFITPRTNGTNEYWDIKWKPSENNTDYIMTNECLCSNASKRCLCEDPFQCTISGGNCFDPNGTYHFNILGSNHFGLLNETYFISPTLEIVKLEKLKSLGTFVGVSSLSLSWSWELQDSFPSNVVECKVSYKLANGEWKSYFTVDNEMTFKNLVPDTIYTIALQCKFQASNYWSDVITVQDGTTSPENVNGTSHICDMNKQQVNMCRNNDTIDINNSEHKDRSVSYSE